MLRYALPEYRLPKAVLDKEIELIERLGVRFVFNTPVGEDISSTTSTPVRRGLPRHRHLEGGLGLPARHRAAGVLPALPFLEACPRGGAPWAAGWW
jgi:NADH-quinone oxidoreductase subunit F